MKATEIQPFTHVTLTFCERRLDTSGQNNFFECDVSLLLEANDMIDVTHAMQPTRFNIIVNVPTTFGFLSNKPFVHELSTKKKNKARHTEKKNNNNKNKNKNNIANCRKNSKNFNTKQHWRMY